MEIPKPVIILAVIALFLFIYAQWSLKRDTANAMDQIYKMYEIQQKGCKQ